MRPHELCTRLSISERTASRLDWERATVMQYVSTRGKVEPVSFSQAVAQGLAPDGGLFLPKQLPSLTEYLDRWKSLAYPDLCFEFMRLFATDIPEAVLRSAVDAAYEGFDHADTAPVKSLSDNLYICELFHGPTLAFKDFALQLLGRLYAYQIQQTGHPINVLGATSGDTGSAAIHGLMNLPGIRIFILYPKNGVAELQEKQMTCTGSSSVFPIAIDGSFDDAQRCIKQLFGDLEFKQERQLSAINSINLARVLAQCVYYLYAWFRIPETKRNNLEVIVPTGNFGNVLAGWILSKMGVAIPKFRIATNRNDILYRLFKTGVYEVSAVNASLAPSMDIQVASNFERFLYYLTGEDPEKVSATMKTFLETGYYRFEAFDTLNFSVSRSSDESILANIASVYKSYGYVLDPHTACAFEENDSPLETRLVMATAHPAKFPDAIRQALNIEVTHPTLEALKSKAVVRYEMDSDPEVIREFIRSNS